MCSTCTSAPTHQHTPVHYTNTVTTCTSAPKHQHTNTHRYTTQPQSQPALSDPYHAAILQVLELHHRAHLDVLAQAQRKPKGSSLKPLKPLKPLLHHFHTSNLETGMVSISGHGLLFTPAAPTSREKNATPATKGPRVYRHPRLNRIK